jgi:uncharacterized protein with PQ loop repeat
MQLSRDNQWLDYIKYSKIDLTKASRVSSFVGEVSWDNVDACNIILSIWAIVKLLINSIKYSSTAAKICNWWLYPVKLEILLYKVHNWSFICNK